MARRRAERRVEPDPVDIYDFVAKLAGARHNEWSRVLMDEESPDWEYLLGLHLQLCELDHLLYRLEDIPL